MKNQNNYLIIGGSTKCGTTSVFNYFEFHPEVCRCIMKESRYFLEESYQLQAKQRSNQQYKSFSDLFSNCNPQSIKIEATPDYLYSKIAADKIKSEIPDCKIVFILRNPVSRLQSWYKYASINGLIERETSFDNYVYKQQQNLSSPDQHMRSLEQGRYTDYLEYYYKIFPENQIHICFYEHLQKNAESFCKEICRFAGIDETYFNNFDFKIYNKSIPVKNVTVHKLFRKLKRGIRPVTKLFPSAIRKRLKLAGYGFEQAYTSVNSDILPQQINISPDMKIFLEEYYLQSNQKLTTITGIQVPWQITNDNEI